MIDIMQRGGPLMWLALFAFVAVFAGALALFLSERK